MVVITEMAWQKTLTILLSHGGSAWVAQTLEHDLAAQGENIDDAIENLSAVLAGQFISDVRAGREPLEACPPAPAYLFERLKRAKRLDMHQPIRLPDDVPPSVRSRTLSPQYLVV